MSEHILKSKSYAFTLRPRNGVTDEHVTTMEKWLRKKARYYHLVTEKTGSSRHIHTGFILEEEKSRSNVSTMLLRLFTDLDSEERRIALQGLKIMYNWDFVNSYLNKDDDTEVICSSLPEEGHIESFFPPRPDVSVNRNRKCSPYYHELEALWYKRNLPGTEVNTRTIRDFLFTLMYRERVISIIRDDKAINQTARHLTRWLKKADESTIELPPFEHEE